jgi:protein CpxP
MKKIMLIGAMIALAIMVGVAGLHAQATVPGGTSPGGSGQPGYGPQGPQGWSCPGWGASQGGSWGMGPGMMYRGWGGGPGMMGPGYGYGYGYGPRYQQPQTPSQK